MGKCSEYCVCELKCWRKASGKGRMNGAGKLREKTADNVSEKTEKSVRAGKHYDFGS